MACHNSKTADQYFSQILNQVKPKARYISQMHSQQYIDSIYLEIVNGDTQIATESKAIQDLLNNQNQKNGFQHMLKMKILSQAEKQKSMLQQKLSYLSNSINALQRYDQLNNRRSPKNFRQSFTVGAVREKEQWRKQIQERSKIIDKKKRQIEQIKVKKQEELKEIQQRVKKQELQRKRKQILEHVKSIEQRSIKRQEQKRSANQRYKQLKKQKSLHQRLSESFNQKQTSFLQQRKKKLAEIRNIHRPLDQLQIKQHEQRFLQSKKQKQEMRQRQKRMNESRSHSYQPFYKSVFYQRALEDSRNESQNAELAKKQKIKQYAQKVKQQFMPEVDQRKREQIQKVIQKQKRRVIQKQQKERQLKQKPRQKGIEYLQLVKKLPKKPRKASADLTASKTQRKQYQNYLTHSEKQPLKPWSKILASNGDKQQKALLLQIQSQKYEQQLKRKQQQVRLMKKGSSGDIDQQYFQMIKAKLDLLHTGA